MKKDIFFIFLVSLSTTLMAQSPQAFNFQTIVRNESGQVVPLQDVTLLFSIRQGDVAGEIIYQEQHIVATNSQGLISLAIGTGEVLVGAFDQIDWQEGDFWLEEQIDSGNTGEFQVFGTVQFLSVPFAMHSSTSENSIRTMTTEERDALENPPVGMQIFNITTKCLNYFNGISWYETCGECTPMPSQANAGPNQYITDETTSTYLEGNSPETGIGTWSVLSGNSGIFEEINDPTTLFIGEDCEYYLLKWVIANPCGTSEDYVSIEFDAQPTPAYAGEDQLLMDTATTTTLEANTPATGEGTWDIVNGQGGSFNNPDNPNTTFTGQLCEIYILRWTTSTPCNSSYDLVEIQFNAIPTTADAGEDQIGLEGSWTTLEANEPMIGEGLWTILHGEGGQVTSPHNPTSIFLGQMNEQYNLQWQILTVCDTTRDEVNIGFGNLPITCGFWVNSNSNRTAIPSLSVAQTNQDVTATPPLPVAQANQDKMATGGITSFTVKSLTSWSVTESSSWLSVKP
nr:hypothetical protein [Bacteroidota bacterium]